MSTSRKSTRRGGATMVEVRRNHVACTSRIDPILPHSSPHPLSPPPRRRTTPAPLPELLSCPMQYTFFKHLLTVGICPAQYFCCKARSWQSWWRSARLRQKGGGGASADSRRVGPRPRATTRLLEAAAAHVTMACRPHRHPCRPRSARVGAWVGAAARATMRANPAV